MVTIRVKTQISWLLASDHRLMDEAIAPIDRIYNKALAEVIKLARSLGLLTDVSTLTLPYNQNTDDE
jgi:hypothetical protein